MKIKKKKRKKTHTKYATKLYIYMYKQIYVTLMKDSRSIMKNLQTKTTKSTKIL